MRNVALKLKVLRKGDQVLNVWGDKLAVRRKGGEVDVLKLYEDEHGLVRIDLARSYQITFGKGEVDLVIEPKSNRSKHPSSGRGADRLGSELTVSTF